MSANTLSVETRLFINGSFVESASGKVFPTHNPATGSVIAEIAEAQAEDVARATHAASAALCGDWSSLELVERARIIRRIADFIERDADDLATLESLDTGKPIRDARAEVAEAALWFDFFADVALKIHSDVIPSWQGYLNYTLFQPVGIVGLIIPWNYPIALCGIKMPAALAMGNAVVLKPAEQTPLTALALASLCREAGVPPGVVNVVPGLGPIAGRALVKDPRVGMISFTGSTAVGREIASAAGLSLTKITLELGGKSPNIVFADADLATAASTSLFTFATNQGQLCTAGTRLLVDRTIHEDFIERLKSMAESLTIGDPLDERTQLGAVISAQQLNRIRSYVASGEEEGARLLTGGYEPRIEGLEGGWFFSPTIFTGVRSGMKVAQEEIFGPVLSVIPFEGEDEALRLANDVLYGLAAAVWTNDLSKAHRLAASIDAGLVYVNTENITAPGSPYSGWKASGIGVEGGLEQAREFTRLKSVWVNISSTAPSL
ncbi:MAG: hypothetical protein DCC49_10685 [Acidobacteria bacterium]|nr:MAG: hypothetical protein DCC49_10685 [Acidobacteriota bacterium]